MAKRSRGEQQLLLPSSDACSKRTKAASKREEVEVVVSEEELRRWRRYLWLSAIGYEDLCRGWFPFVEEDFCCDGGLAWDDDCCLGFDDIWQIKNIHEVPIKYLAK